MASRSSWFCFTLDGSKKAKGSPPRSNPRHSGGRRAAASLLRFPAEFARCHAAERAALLLEVRVPFEIRAGAAAKAAEHAGRIVSPHSGIVLFPIDGALNRLPESHSAVGNRDAGAVINIRRPGRRPTKTR